MIPTPPKEWAGTEDEWLAFITPLAFSSERLPEDLFYPIATPQPVWVAEPPPTATPEELAQRQRDEWARSGTGPMSGWLLLGAAGLLGWWFLRGD